MVNTIKTIIDEKSDKSNKDKISNLYNFLLMEYLKILYYEYKE